VFCLIYSLSYDLTNGYRVAQRLRLTESAFLTDFSIVLEKKRNYKPISRHEDGIRVQSGSSAQPPELEVLDLGKPL
jgi:hypothetical protein